MSEYLNKPEKEIQKLLEKVLDLFDSTPAFSPDEAAAFRQAISSAQNLITLRDIDRANQAQYPSPKAKDETVAWMLGEAPSVGPSEFKEDLPGEADEA